MKRVYVAYTFLDTIEVPDDWTADDVQDMLDEKTPEEIANEASLNDKEWDWVR